MGSLKNIHSFLPSCGDYAVLHKQLCFTSSCFFFCFYCIVNFPQTDSNAINAVCFADADRKIENGARVTERFHPFWSPALLHMETPHLGFSLYFPPRQNNLFMKWLSKHKAAGFEEISQMITQDVMHKRRQINTMLLPSIVASTDVLR